MIHQMLHHSALARSQPKAIAQFGGRVAQSQPARTRKVIVTKKATLRKKKNKIRHTSNNCNRFVSKPDWLEPVSVDLHLIQNYSKTILVSIFGRYREAGRKQFARENMSVIKLKWKPVQFRDCFFFSVASCVRYVAHDDWCANLRRFDDERTINSFFFSLLQPMPPRRL